MIVAQVTPNPDGWLVEAVNIDGDQVRTIAHLDKPSRAAAEDYVYEWADLDQLRIGLIIPVTRHARRERVRLSVKCIGRDGCGIVGMQTTMADARRRLMDHDESHHTAAIIPIKEVASHGQGK